MLPSGRNNSSRSSYSEQQRTISDKEEIARAALRSLASPSATSTPNEPQLLPPPPPLATPSYSAASSTTQLPPPHPSQYAPSRELPRPSIDDDDYHRDDRAAPYDRRGPAGLRETGMTRDSSSSSFFHEQAITTSPESSPILAAAPSLPPLHARHSIPSTSASSDVHEVAIRRASIALGVNIEEVRHIVHNAYVSRRTSSTSSSAASAAASSQGYLPPSSAQEHESAFVRQVLDTYSLESDRASHPSHPSHPHPHSHSHSDYDYDARRTDAARVSSSSYASSRAAAAAEPSGMTRHDAGPSSYRAPQYQAPYSLTDRAPPQVGWGSTASNLTASHDARYLHHGTFRSAYPAYQETRRQEGSTSSAMSSTSNAPIPEQRADSPSPFAYDAYRRTSQPIPPQEPGYVATGATSSSSTRMATRASQDYLDELARGRAIDEERRAGPRSRYPLSSYAQQHPHVPPSSMYERRVRSIDDYLDQQQHQQQHQLPRRRRGSIAYYPGRSTATLAEHEDDMLPDRHIRSSNRYSFQPYPAPGSRYATGPSSAAAASSPQLSPTMPEPPRFQQFSQQQFSQLRSPAPRSPAAETVASSSVASVAGMTPSPLLGAVGSSSANLASDDRERESKPSPGVGSDRSVSVDTAAESTRAGVAKMHIDDEGSTPKAPRAAGRKPGSSRSSFSHSDRGSAPIAGTDLSHSEIMQRLQNKVKSRLAAKGKAASAAGSSTGGNRVARLARANSTKRSASSITKSDSPTRASPASPTPSGSRAGESKSSSSSNNNNMEAPTAEKSASPLGGVPAPKVRRTSVSSQQKPAPKPSPKSPPSKPASPTSTAKSNATPTSIEAALLSLTDTPTPSEAAATHAQLMSRSPLSPAEGVVESASGQALPGDLPGAGQMNAASATKQQTSKSRFDSLIQAAQASDPTETNSAIA